MSGVELRLRRPEDLPGLGELLLEQQPVSDYPHVRPKLEAVAAFLARSTEEAAWVAVRRRGGVEELLGHVAVTRIARGAEGEEETLAWCEGAGCAPEELRVVGALFVGLHATGLGAGVALLRRATEHVLDAGRVPCLDVLPTHDRAVALYRHLGWVEVGRLRPDWLADWAPEVIAMVHPAGRRG